jgi:predicted transcriptional regulator of viral defense system
MLIGQNSNNAIYDLLLTITELAGGVIKKRIKVADVHELCKLEEAELKHIMGYLTERGWISADSIGGPLLYDEISLTQDGLEKAQSIQND